MVGKVVGAQKARRTDVVCKGGARGKKLKNRKVLPPGRVGGGHGRRTAGGGGMSMMDQQGDEFGESLHGDEIKAFASAVTGETRGIDDLMKTSDLHWRSGFSVNEEEVQEVTGQSTSRISIRDEEKGMLPSVMEYFNMGARLGESVEQTTRKIIRLKVHSGAMFHEDSESDPFHLLDELNTFLDNRESHETFGNFVKRCGLPTRSEEEAEAMYAAEIEMNLDVSDEVRRPKMPTSNTLRSLKSEFDAAEKQTSPYDTLEQDLLAALEEGSRKLESKRRKNNKAAESEGEDAKEGELSAQPTPDASTTSLPQRMKAIQSLSVGDTFSGTVTRLSDFGAFISIFTEEEQVAIDGCCYLPDLPRTKDDKRVVSPEDSVKIGDVHFVTVASTCEGTGRVRFTLDGADANGCDGEIEEVEMLREEFERVDKIKAVSVGLCVDQLKAVGGPFQLLMSAALDGGYEVVARKGRLQQDLFVATDMQKDELGGIIKNVFDKS